MKNVTAKKNLNSAVLLYTLGLAFRHLPPNSARIGYAHRRGTLYLRAAVHRRCQRPPKGLDCESSIASKYANKHEARPAQVKNEFRSLGSNDCGLICAGVSNVAWAAVKEMPGTT